MIQKLEITGVHTEISEDLREYVKQKIGKLDKYISRHAQESAHVEVWLKANKTKNKQLQICEVVIKLPHDELLIKETNANMFAAVDIVETKLKTQLKKYKETHETKRLQRKVLAQIRRRTA